MVVISWFRALFTVDLKNLEADGLSATFVYLWRFVIMGFLAKWCWKVWLGIDLPFLFDKGHIFTVSKYPDELFFGCLLFFGLTGLLLTEYVTFWSLFASILMFFGVFESFKNWFMMLFAALIMGLAHLIFNIFNHINGGRKVGF